jgi:uroporphyrinogen-III synthase
MKSLDNKRILITRTTADNAVWAVQLRERGAVVIERACIERRVIESAGPELEQALNGAAWLVLPSPTAVHSFRKLSSLPSGVRIACTGPSSAQLAEQELGRCDLISAAGTMTSLAQELGDLGATTIVIAGAEETTMDLQFALRPKGFTVRHVPTYRTQPATLAKNTTVTSAEAQNLDAIFLASPSALVGLRNVMELSNTPLITIGPTTSAAVTSAGLEVAAEAQTRDLDGLIDAFLCIQ